MGIPPRLFRLVYAFEFLLAVLAIFTAWSEIGGQAALDIMHWGWKLGLSVGLAGAIVGFTAAIAASDSFWTLRSARWLTAIIVIILAAGAITYYYVLQEDTGDSEDTGNISLLGNPRKTGPESSMPPKELASSLVVWWHGTVPFALYPRPTSASRAS